MSSRFCAALRLHTQARSAASTCFAASHQNCTLDGVIQLTKHFLANYAAGSAFIAPASIPLICFR